MWLLPVFSVVARLALSIFYRFRIAGTPVPASGPVLLVANHPNALIDPAAVVAAARRPVRFLAKAPLFSNPLVGWLVRAAGAVPVFRQVDDPALMNRNEDSFRAVFEVLGSGAVVGIFPEGQSHDGASLTPLRTGAARIALGASGGSAFPIVPVGLSLRDKQRFRSEALALVGEPVQWRDLADRPTSDFEAVRELTARIDAALRQVTVNLRRWEDAPVVEYAQEIVLAERGVQPTPDERVAAMREAATGLRTAEEQADPRWDALVRDVREHGRALDSLGLRPALLTQPGERSAVRWAARSVAIFLISFPVEVVGYIVFVIPFFATDALARRLSPSPDSLATYKLMAGALVFTIWTCLVTAVAAFVLGPLPGAAMLLLLPLLGIATIVIREWRIFAFAAVRRYQLRRRRREVIADLKARQKALAERILEARDALLSGEK